MEIKFNTVLDEDTMLKLADLTPRQFMIAWTGAVRRLIQTKAREKIGGDFGDQIARESIQTDETNPMVHRLYLGGTNGVIAEHIHNGGVIRPKPPRKYLAIPIDPSAKGLYAREYPADLVLIRRKNDGPNGRAYLAKPMKRKIKPIYVLKNSVYQPPRPWFPTESEVEEATRNFFESAF